MNKQQISSLKSRPNLLLTSFHTFRLETWKKNRYNSLCRRINVKIDDALPTFYFSFEFHRVGYEKKYENAHIRVALFIALFII